MTREEREEAIKYFEDMMPCVNRRIQSVFETAIEALKAETCEEDLHREREQAYMQGYEDASKRFRIEPCENAVSREAVLDALHASGRPNKIFDYILVVQQDIMALPPVTPKPRTGKWIRQGNDYTDYYECEHCGIAVGLDDIKNFCPNCGAKMEGEGESK